MRNKRKVRQLKKKRKKECRDKRRKSLIAQPPPALRLLPTGNAVPIGEPGGPGVKPSPQLMSAFAEELEQHRGGEGRKLPGGMTGPKRPSEYLAKAPRFEIAPIALIVATVLVVLGILATITHMLPW
jgi:hypothetical protein